MNKKILVLPLAALAATLTACGTSAPAPAVTHTATSASASSTPAASTSAQAATASSVGTWNVAYTSAPAAVLGQYSITQPTTGTYTITTETALRLPDGNCSVPINTEEGTFTGVGPTTFSGTAKVWEPGTCAYAYMSAFTLAFSGGNELTMQFANAEPTSFTLTRMGSAPSSTTSCLVPDLLDATSVSAAALVRSAGFQSVVLTAKTFPGNSSTSPGHFPAGFVWGTNPPETTRAACGSTVTVYYQPSSSSPAAAAPPASSSTASCIVPNVIGDGTGVNGHRAAEVAVNYVATSCPPVGFHVVVVLTVSGPAGTPQGTIWKESPPAGTSVPFDPTATAPTTTVTLYFQP